MDCTIVICTRDRATQLRSTLHALCALRVPATVRWDVLVVDNGSSDDTAAVVASFADQLDIARLPEPVAGLSNARNAGLRRARGRHIVWTDDDVLVEPGWLAAYVEAFGRHPDAAVFGGKVTPVLRGPTPPWFAAARHELGFLLAERDFGPAERPLALADDCIPYGANFAVRAREQRLYPYDPELGVAPGRRRGGEETAVVKAMLRDGLAGWWVPEAAVLHDIPPSRQTRDYVARFYEALGESWAFPLVRHATRRRVPLSTLAKVGLAFVRLQGADALRLRVRVRYLASLSFHRGVLRAFRHHDPVRRA